MALTMITRGLHWEDADLVTMARIRGLDGVLIQQANLDSITARVYDLADDSLIGTPLSLDIAATVFDTPVTGDSRWSVDGQGYNFRATIPGSYFPAGNTQERIEITFTPVTGAPFPFVVEVNVENLLTS